MNLVFDHQIDLRLIQNWGPKEFKRKKSKRFRYQLVVNITEMGISILTILQELLMILSMALHRVVESSGFLFQYHWDGNVAYKYTVDQCEDDLNEVFSTPFSISH